jgi:SAM-dependent methyltransferase
MTDSPPQAYSPAFAGVYNRLWTDFARQVAPRVRALYEATALGQARRPVLDLCCGTGQLAQHFLEHGFPVVGLDLSPAMLEHAARNTLGYVASFSLPERFGLVVSTFDALNHLPGLDALQACFRSVRAVLAPGGLFVFDLNTPVGLGRWAGQRVQALDDLVLVQRGEIDHEARKAWMTILGFVRRPDGLYERFEERIFNTIFELWAVEQALAEAGFTLRHPALPEDLAVPAPALETAGRVFFVAE